MKVHSIFTSLSGEAGFFIQGSWCNFIRLQGCNLSCIYCDTRKAQSASEGREYSLEEICECLDASLPQVLITGGEPLVQREELSELIGLLIARGRIIQIETNGSLPISDELEQLGVFWVVDYKGPSASLSDGVRDPHEFAQLLGLNCRVKFVIADEADLEQAIFVMRHLITKEAYQERFIISPVGADASKGKWIVDRISREWIHVENQQVICRLLSRIIFSLQMHKIVDLP